MRLNLGSGPRRLDGYVNVDREQAAEPDQVWDLERTPWPWMSGTVDEIAATHVLEHIANFRGFVTECHRLLRPGGLFAVTVPHPNGDAFWGDPTHVRPVTLGTMMLLSRRECARFRENGWPNSPLAEYWGVDFEIEGYDVVLEREWAEKKLGAEALAFAVRTYANVVSEVRFRMRRV